MDERELTPEEEKRNDILVNFALKPLQHQPSGSINLNLAKHITIVHSTTMVSNMNDYMDDDK